MKNDKKKETHLFLADEQMAKEKAVTKPTTRDSRYPSMTSTAKSTSSSDSSASPVLTRKVIRYDQICYSLAKAQNIT